MAVCEPARGMRASFPVVDIVEFLELHRVVSSMTTLIRNILPDLEIYSGK